MIGSGAPHYAKAFKESVGGNVPIYTDMALRTFAALSFKRGLGGLLKGAMWKKGFDAFKQGYRQGKVQGDAQQLGGVLGLSSSGDVLYKYTSEFAGDHPELDIVLEAMT